MALDDYVEGEVGTAVAVTAVLFSPRARGALRRIAIYGLAGGIKVVDIVAGAARGVGRGVSEGASGSDERVSQGVFSGSPTEPATPVILPSEAVAAPAPSAGTRGRRGSGSASRRTRES